MVSKWGRAGGIQLFKKKIIKSFVKMLNNQKLRSRDVSERLCSLRHTWKKKLHITRFLVYQAISVQPPFHSTSSVGGWLLLSCANWSQHLHGFLSFVAEWLLQLTLCWGCPCGSPAFGCHSSCPMAWLPHFLPGKSPYGKQFSICSWAQVYV